MSEQICALDVERLVETAVRNAVPRDTRKAPRWVAVMQVFAVGSTSGHELCRWAGVDPDEEVKRPKLYK